MREPRRTTHEREDDRHRERGSTIGDRGRQRARHVVADRGATFENRGGVAQRGFAQGRGDAFADPAFGNDAGEIDAHDRAALWSEQRLDDQRATGSVGAGEQYARRRSRERTADPLHELERHHDLADRRGNGG